MSSITPLLQGAIVGFSASAPIGPLSIVCIQRTLRDGWLTGFLSGVGAAGGMSTYALIDGLGASFIPGFLAAHETALNVFSGIVLCLFGIYFGRMPIPEAGTAPRMSHARSILSAFLLECANPAGMLIFLGFFISLGALQAGQSVRSLSLLVLGTFVGSSVWWLIQAVFVASFRSFLQKKFFRWVNVGAGVCIVGFGVLAFLRIG